MILFIRSNGIVSDPRIAKYIDFIDKTNSDYCILGWDRKQENIHMKNACFYRKKMGYNIGGIRAVYGRLLWMFFCLKYLFKHKCEVIHGCDLDSVFPAVLFKICGHPKVNIIFDVFDWFSATLAGQSKWILMIFKFMEYLSVKKSNSIIICEEERKAQIPYDISHKLHILPNIPSFYCNDFMWKDEKLLFCNERITLSYVGGLYNERFLDELLLIASEGHINLLIAGYGDETLEKKCYALNRLENVRFFGKVSYDEGVHIMFNSDIIYAMYCKTNPNHIFAAPNKFYEAMLLSKALISTKGTIVGDKIEKMNIGYAIEESIVELRNLIKNIKKEDVAFKGRNANIMWNKKYKDYVSNFLSNEYLSLI